MTYKFSTRSILIAINDKLRSFPAIYDKPLIMGETDRNMLDKS
jgi:hypothetical protein